MITLTPYPDRTWWHRGKPHSRLELIGDAVIHGIGLLVALGLGGLLVAGSGIESTLALGVYVASLLVLSIHLWAVLDCMVLQRL